jgi:hypothetical protein
MSVSLKLTGVLQDLIQSILDTIGCSPGGPQPEQVRQGMVCFQLLLLRLSRLPFPLEYLAQRGARNGQEDRCSCDLQHAQTPDV